MQFCLLGLLAWAATAWAADVSAGAVPSDRLSEKWWADRHAAIVERVKAKPDVQLLMVGDSITQNYEKANAPDEDFAPVWKQFYEPRRALNLGFSGDTTAHVLWRLRHGEVDGLKPKTIVLLIGTNNTGRGQSAEQTEVGIDAVVKELETRLPESRILLVGILPSDGSAEKTAADREVNRYLAAVYGEHPMVTYLDIGSIFYDGERLKSEIFYDPRLKPARRPLHPDTVGQRRMAEAIEPTLAKLMGDARRGEGAEVNTALIPVGPLEADSYDWYARHHAVVDQQRRVQPRVVMIGDSITHFWGGRPVSARRNGPDAWEHLFGTDEVLNMGFGWDRTQNVLWRLRQGEFTGIHPEWAVVLIGTNNLAGTKNARANTPAEIVEGIAAICAEVRRRSPGTRIALMKVLPRGTADSPFRGKIAEVNRLMEERFRGVAGVTVLDAGPKFVEADGTLPKSLMPDGVHPSEAGYELWAEVLRGAGVVK